MKKHKKILVLLLAALLLVTATVFVTMAYLTSEKKVENTFTVGKVNIKLDEALVDSAGQPGKLNENSEFEPVGNVENADRVDGNMYKLFPNHVYVKDPTVTVLEGSDESYVRMFVHINNATYLDEYYSSDNLGEAGANLSEIFLGFNDTKWEYKGHTTENDVRVLEFWYKEIAPAVDTNTKLAPLFEKIKVPAAWDADVLNDLNTKDFKIDIVAQAIQADGFTDAADAWLAW